MRWPRFCESIEAGPTPSSPPPFRGRNPVWRGLVMTASLEFANRFVSNAIALKGEDRRGSAEPAVGVELTRPSPAYGQRKQRKSALPQFLDDTIGEARPFTERVAARPTPTCPPPFRGRDPVARSRFISSQHSLRGGFFICDCPARKGGERRRHCAGPTRDKVFIWILEWRPTRDSSHRSHSLPEKGQMRPTSFTCSRVHPKAAHGGNATGFAMCSTSDSAAGQSSG